MDAIILVRVCLNLTLHSILFQIQIKKGELVTLYGPTGTGKTSVLRMLAGLMEPTDGTIEVDNLPPQKRSIGIVFQEYSLFPNMTVRENLEFGLTKGQEKKIVDELLEVS